MSPFHSEIQKYANRTLALLRDFALLIICSLIGGIVGSRIGDTLGVDWLTIVIAVIGSGAAAFAGAYGAQQISERQKDFRDGVERLRATNAAITTSYSIFNAAMNLKRDIIKPTFDSFNDARQAFIAHLAGRKAGTIDPDMLLEITYDMRSVSVPPLPLHLLEKQLFEQSGTVGRPLIMFPQIALTVSELRAAAIRREEFISAHKVLSAKGGQISPFSYFGIRASPEQTHLDTTIGDCIEALKSHVDSVIFFSKTICKDLGIESKKIKLNLKKQFRASGLTSSKVDFTKLIDASLLPDEKEFESWRTSYVDSSTINN